MMTCKELAEMLMCHPDKPVYVSVDADNGEYLFPLDCVISEQKVTNVRTGAKTDCVVIEIGELPCSEDEDDDYNDDYDEDEDDLKVAGNTTMTRDEMIEFIKSNPCVKITHTLFDASEHIYSQDNGNVYDERGYLFEDWYSNARDGIRSRIGGRWETGWSIKR